MLALNDPPSDPNELAATRAHGTACVATLRDGWYGLERASGHTWAWSHGRAAIAFEAWPKDTPVLRLEFAMRGVVPLTVILRQADRELWRGSVGVQLTPRQSVPVRLADGHASIEFSTGAPGVRENGNADARLITFAIDDARVIVPKP